MRTVEDIRRIIVHCSATKPSMSIGVPEIREWHTAKGWSDIGYHFVIKRGGLVQGGRPVEQVGAHALHHNHDTIGICLVGGVDEEGKPDANFTFMQYRSLDRLVRDLTASYPNIRMTGNYIMGHRDLPGVKKACPCFDVRAFFGMRAV
jgi:N-acetyl-anhydromuramyl-L-alanine amidase AmpD